MGEISNYFDNHYAKTMTLEEHLRYYVNYTIFIIRKDRGIWFEFLGFQPNSKETKKPILHLTQRI